MHPVLDAVKSVPTRLDMELVDQSLGSDHVFWGLSSNELFTVEVTMSSAESKYIKSCSSSALCSTVAHIRRRDLAQAPAQWLLRILLAPVEQSSPMHSQQTRGASRPNRVCLLRPPRQPASLARLDSFFETISCGICRSSERSATSRFSLPFSSRSCLSHYALRLTADPQGRYLLSR